MHQSPSFILTRMAKKNLERELREFKETLKKRLDKISKDKNIVNITKADQKFMNLYNIAAEKSLEYGTHEFKEAFKSSLAIYNDIINYKIDYVSRMNEISEKIWLDNHKDYVSRMNEISEKIWLDNHKDYVSRMNEISEKIWSDNYKEAQNELIEQTINGKKE